MTHRPALDGLRGVAVLAVVAYHLEPDRVPGGFLGVEAFFTLSGFLITSLLLAEHAETGRISLPAFWARRARRLLPALLLFLAVVVTYAAAVLPASSRPGLRADGLAALAYASNWWQLADDQSYFDLSAGASPLAHLWSLAIEEQFYVVWPLVVAVGLRWRLGVLCAAGAVASFGLMAAVDPARAYLGTDTRAGGLLLGAGLAVVLRRRPAPRAAGPVALVAVAGWAAATMVVEESTVGLYRGGLAAFGLGMVAVVAASVSDRPSWARSALSLRPLRAVGRVSYGLYLWHWPVIVLLTAGRTGFRGPALLAARVAAMAALTLVSYRLVEQPVRRGRLPRPVARVAAPAGAVAVAVGLVLATVGGQPPPAYAVAGPPGPDVTVPEAPAGATARLLLVGDSVAYTLHPALDAEVTARGIAFAGATAPGCGMVGGTPLGRDGAEPSWTATCAATVPALHERFVAEFDPDVVVWLSTWESLPRRVGDRVLQPGDPALDAWLLDAMGEVVDRLTAGGATVVVLTVPPEVDAATGDAEPAWNDDLQHLNGLFRRLAATSGGRVRIVDLAEIVCPSRPCPPYVDGVTLRPDDGVHYGPEGARWVAARVIGPVLRAAAP